MKRENWTVGDYSIRPAGSQKHCFYCGAKKGEVHNTGCVIRSKTIKVKFSVDMVLKVPEDWDEKQISFRYNEGTYCSSNFINELKAAEDNGNCLCFDSEIKYIREATEKDEDNWGVYKVKEFLG